MLCMRGGDSSLLRGRESIRFMRFTDCHCRIAKKGHCSVSFDHCPSVTSISLRIPLTCAEVTSQANRFWRPEVNETCTVTSFPPYLNILIADLFHTFIRTSVGRYFVACPNN